MSERRRPGRPDSPEPPPDLAAIAVSIRHPAITRSGLTTTPDGQWALFVRVKPGTSTPIPAIEAASGSYAVVYETEPAEPPIARPAYPDRGE